MMPPMVTTERLILRQWREEDIAPLAEMSTDPEVMAHFPALLDVDGARNMWTKLHAWVAEHGHGFWAVEVKATGAFAGFCGIKAVNFDAPFTPAYEIGWRLARPHWGKGYATEGGRAAIEYGFRELGLDELVAFLLPANRRSAAVCERLGMTRDPAEDFDHPWFTAEQRALGGELQGRHALYRLQRR